MFGEKSFEIIKELLRQHCGTCGVAPFDETGIRQVYEEMQSLYDENQKAVVADSEGTQENSGTVAVASLYLRHAALERNKRCIITYMYRRLERIRELRWVKGSVLSESDQMNMNEQEIEYFTKYNKLIANYMKSLGEESGYSGLDLTQDDKPPKCSMIYFRVLQDYGEFETDEGDIIVLKKKGTHNLPRDQCEGLIKQGIIEVIKEVSDK